MPFGFGAVQLGGSGSFDPDGDTVNYSWTISSVPSGSTATLDDSTIVNPSFILDLLGNYVIDLVVCDGTFDSPVDSVSITVFLLL